MIVTIAELCGLLGKSEQETAQVGSKLGELTITGSANYRFHEFKSAGVSFAFKSPLGTEAAGNPENRLAAVHLYGANQGGNREYSGDLPFGLAFGEPVDRARAKLPEATHGAAKQVPILGMSREWLKSPLHEGVTIRVEFDNETGKLVLATLEPTTSPATSK